jgi:hypothetical protein
MTERIFRVRDIPRARDVFALAWAAGRLFTEPFEIVLRPLKAKRSADQNRRYWALLRDVAEVAWINGRQFSDETWHEHFKRELIGREEIILPSGEVEVRGISTTTLSVGDMGTYMDSIERWCVEQGFPLEEAA